MKTNSKSEEIVNVLVDITQCAVKEQEINTIAFYPIEIDKENNLEIKIRKEEDKYKILQFGDKWKTIKRSDIESIEILLNLSQIMMLAFQMIKQNINIKIFYYDTNEK